jgi:uncharacterized membrane protein YfcA
MDPDHLIQITVCMGIVAFLYSSVGHAGASGYIAVMTLFSMTPSAIKPTALVLNIIVACIGTWQFWRAGHFSWSFFWPFAVLSVPCAFIGGYLNLPSHVFKLLVGIVLLFSAARFLLDPEDAPNPHAPSKPVSCGVGAGLGLLAGLTGTGGGIFLTPLVILMGWARTKTASAVSALFILVNSVSGLAGNLSATQFFPTFAWSFVASALVCGTAGSYLGSRKFSPVIIKRLLAVVLTLAGLKLLLFR